MCRLYVFPSVHNNCFIINHLNHKNKVRKNTSVGVMLKRSNYSTPSTSRGVNAGILENDLKKKWSTLGNAISYAGITKIYKYYGKQLSKDRIERVLFSISTYTKHKEIKSPRSYNPFFIYFKRHRWQVDITYVNSLSQWNDGIKFCLL